MESDKQGTQQIIKIEMALVTWHSSGNNFRWLYSVKFHCTLTVVGLQYEGVN